MSSDKPVRLALLGCGTVGSEVVRLLHEQSEDLTARIGAPLELVGIAVRRPGRERGDLPVDSSLFTTDALGLVKRDDVDLVIEVVGGIEPARTWLVEALRSGKSVITANKALLAEDANANTPWTSGGNQFTVTFRPLLPDETGCADLKAVR